MDEINVALNKMENENGFFKNNNYHIVSIDKKECIIKAILDENSMNPFNNAHGGLIFGLGDTIMGIHIAICGNISITLNSNINYLKPGNGKYLIAKSHLIKQGINVSYLKCDIYNDKDELIATMDSNYFNINK